MKVLNTDVKQALESNQALVSMLGPDRIIKQVFPDDRSTPFVVYQELNNAPGQFADDKTFTSAILYQIDIWSLKQPIMAELKIQVNESIESIGFIRTSTSGDLYEDDTEFYHYAMRYRISVL